MSSATGQYSNPEAYRQALMEQRQREREKQPGYGAVRTPEQWQMIKHPESLQAPKEEPKTVRIPEKSPKAIEGMKLPTQAPKTIPPEEAFLLANIYYRSYEQKLQTKYPQRLTDPTQFAAYNREMRESPIYQTWRSSQGLAEQFFDSKLYRDITYLQGKVAHFKTTKAYRDIEYLRGKIEHYKTTKAYRDAEYIQGILATKKGRDYLYMQNLFQTKEARDKLYKIGVTADWQKRQSKAFYEGIGYPELGGKYAPFTVPEGAQVSKITETEQGLTIEFVTGGGQATPVAPEFDYSQLSPIELEYLRLSSGAGAPPRSHLGPPSGYSYTPINLDELVQQGKVTVEPAKGYGGGVFIEPPTEAFYKGMLYSEIAEKYSGKAWNYNVPKATAPTIAGIGKQISDLTLEGYNLKGIETIRAGPMGSELFPQIQPLSTAKIITYEKIPTSLAPSGMEKLSKSSSPVVGGFARDVLGAEEIRADPLSYSVKKVFEIGSASLGLVMPTVGAVSVKAMITGAGLNIGAQQLIKSTGLQISLDRGVFFGEAGGLLTPQEAFSAGLTGIAFTGLSGGISRFVGAGTSIIASPTAKALVGITAKTILTGGATAGLSYVASGGDIKAARTGFVLGAGLSLGQQAGSAVYGRYLKPYVDVGTAKLQARADRYLTQKYLETGRVGLSEKALARIIGVKAPSQQYIKSGGEWTLAREEATIGRALIPKEITSSKASPVTSWAKGTQWTKPSSVKSTLNRYIGSGQAVSLKTLQMQTPKTIAISVTKAPSFPALIPVTATKTMQKQQQKTLTVVSDVLGVSWQQQDRQTANPFIVYGGKPFYGTKARSREEYETMFLSYPLSGLAAPAQLSRQTENITQMPAAIPVLGIMELPQTKQIPTLKEVTMLKPIQKVMPQQAPLNLQSLLSKNITVSRSISKLKYLPFAMTMPIQTLRNAALSQVDTVQFEKQLQRVAQQTGQLAMQIQRQKTTGKPLQLKDDFDKMLRRNMRKDFMGGYGRQKRQYPIMTPEEMLKHVLNGRGGRRKR